MYHRDHLRVGRSRQNGNELCLVWFGLDWFQLKILAATHCKNKNINIKIWSRNSTKSTLFIISWSTLTSGLTLLVTVTIFGNHLWIPTPSGAGALDLDLEVDPSTEASFDFFLRDFFVMSGKFDGDSLSPLGS
jgi:hypothetical protein